MKNIKNQNFYFFILFCFLIKANSITWDTTNSNININYENDNDNKKDEFLKAKQMEDLIKFYNENPGEFITSHSNKENFITVFSNFTRLNGEILYEEYIESKHHKDIQSVLDNLNKFNSRGNVNNWDFDSKKGKFVITDEIRNYQDFYKWQMIISIMKTMNKFPVIRKDENLNYKKQNLRGNSNVSLVFREDIKIANPPTSK